MSRLQSAILYAKPRTLPSSRPAPVPLVSALLLALAAGGAARAQTPPALPDYGIGNAIRDAQPPRPDSPAPQRPAPRIVPPPPPMSLPSSDTLMVREFQFDGAADAPDVPEAELQGAVAPYRGRTLTMAQIDEAAGKATEVLRDHGYLVARVYVPQQDATAGTLRLQVVLGAYGRVAAKNQSLVRGWPLDRLFEPLSDSRRPVRRDDIERRMLLASDLPGARLPRLTISPGRTPGTSDFDVEVPAGPRVGGYVSADNQGSRYTGRGRLAGGLQVNSPLGIGDRFSADLLGASGDGLDNGRVAYSLPLLPDGLRGEVAYSRATYSLGGQYSDLDATGAANTIEAGLSYPVLRGSTRNLYVTFGLASRDLHDSIGTLDSYVAKRSNKGSLGLRYEEWGHVGALPSYTVAGAGVTYGRLGFQDPAQEAFNRAGANTAGNYAYVKAEASTQIELAPAWTLTGSAGVQHSLNRNLDTSEQMIISGPGGVGAFRETVSGDNGYILSAQLRYALPVPAGAGGPLTHSVGLFTDVGHVTLQHGGYSAYGGQHIADVGLGYYVRYRQLFGQLMLARVVGPLPATADQGRTRVLLQVGAQF